MSYVDPQRPQFEAFKALTRDHQIDMLNLVRLRERAVYPDGREASGAEAYAAYGRESGPIFQRVGGVIAWRGRPETLLIGPEDERWDIAFIARYPSAAAFLEMVTDKRYQSEAVPHRQAGVEDSRLLRLAAAPAGAGFAGGTD